MPHAPSFEWRSSQRVQWWSCFTKENVRSCSAAARSASSALLRDLLDAPTALAACCGFDLCNKYILYCTVLLQDSSFALASTACTDGEQRASPLPQRMAGRPCVAGFRTKLAYLLVDSKTRLQPCVCGFHENMHNCFFYIRVLFIC